MREKLRVTVLQSSILKFPALIAAYVSAKNFGSSVKMPFTFLELVGGCRWW